MSEPIWGHLGPSGFIWGHLEPENKQQNQRHPLSSSSKLKYFYTGPSNSFKTGIETKPSARFITTRSHCHHAPRANSTKCACTATLVSYE